MATILFYLTFSLLDLRRWKGHVRIVKRERLDGSSYYDVQHRTSTHVLADAYDRSWKDSLRTSDRHLAQVRADHVWVEVQEELLRRRGRTVAR